MVQAADQDNLYPRSSVAVSSCPARPDDGHYPYGYRGRGRFAAGPLGGLTPFLPFELVDAVQEETRAAQHRLRDLPSRVGVYFLGAMCLFPEVGYRLVWDKLTSGTGGVLPAPVRRVCAICAAEWVAPR